MAEEQQLSYPMPVERALGMGAAFGLAMGAADLFMGNVRSGAFKATLFACLSLVTFRFVHKCIIHRRGFSRYGTEFDWADVAEATVVSGTLKMELRNAGPTDLPPFIVEDPRFAAAIREWLREQHPVRRALEGPPSAQANADSVDGRT